MPVINAQYCPETGTSLRLTFDTQVVGVDPVEYAIDSVIAHALSNAVQTGTPFEWFMTIDPPLYQSEFTALNYTGSGTVDTSDEPEALAPFSGHPIENASTVPLPDPPPATPTNLAAMGGDAQVNLTWNANGEPDLAGYNVYRSDSLEGVYYLIGTTTLSTYRDNDGPVNGVESFYRISAIDNGANESALSDPASATPAAPPPPALANSGLSVGMGLSL
ncbi:MAG: hypothetical protein JWN40_2209 [Phycisphaerales bacterium]|nr:hypothetical protein [Phycisphaerales bacterium]